LQYQNFILFCPVQNQAFKLLNYKLDAKRKVDEYLMVKEGGRGRKGEREGGREKGTMRV